MSETYAKEFESIVSKAKAAKHPMRVAVAGADVENILRGVFDAQKEGFVEPILIGNQEKITAMLQRLGLEDRPYELQGIDEYTSPVQFAIEIGRAHV